MLAPELERVKPEWRWLRGWTSDELKARLARLDTRASTNDEPSAFRLHYRSRALIGRELPGPPQPRGVFERAQELVTRYDFSDPRIVVGHFDPSSPLVGRRMLLEIRILGLRYLCGVVVSELCDRAVGGKSYWGFRYETLAGHIERGDEWFLIDKTHDTGEVAFRINARWREGQFPNWWSRLGFRLLARHYQRAWNRLAYVRLRQRLGEHHLAPLPRGRDLVHMGPRLPGPPIAAVAEARASTQLGIEENT